MSHSPRNRSGSDGPRPISSFFEKHLARIRPPQGIVIDAFCAVVESELGIELDHSTVRYSPHTQTISVLVSGPRKSEILLNKERILTCCEDTLGGRSTPKHLI